MKRYLLLLIGLTLATSPGWARGISALFTSGAYDAAQEPNAVDREAAANRQTLAQFKLDVAAAFANGTGGVITFDRARPGIDPDGSNGRSGNYPDDRLSIFFGLDQASSLEMSVDRVVMTNSRGRSSYSMLDIWQGNRLHSTPISGPMIKNDGRPATAGAFLTPGTNIDNDKVAKLNFSNGQIRQLGVTALSANAPQTMTITVFFSGGLSESQSERLAAGAGADDVFFYFAAPPRQTIVSMRWQSDTINRPGIDDLAFLFDAPARCMFVVDD
ncbi:MAG: hypothetical protein ABFD92_02230 [Planctomycetaceae bacterium]|nr:hypothetical protein [Planctomycetaceae bacterium]